MTLSAHAGGSWRIGKVLPWGMRSGYWSLARVGYTRRSGFWTAIAQRLESISITGTISIPRGNTVSDTVAQGAGLSSTAAGGYGAVSYSWARLSGSALITGGSLTSTPWFFQSVAGASTFRCTATDALTGDVVTRDWTITWT